MLQYACFVAILCQNYEHHETKTCIDSGSPAALLPVFLGTVDGDDGDSKLKDGLPFIN